MILYKYYSINKNFISWLSQRSFWFSKPQNFNDPFEFKIQELSEKDIDNLDIKSLEAINPWYSRKDLIEKALDTYQNELYNFWICSFSEIRDNILMWWHYADSHKWICIWFDIWDTKQSGFHKIQYTEQYPNIDLENVWHIDWLAKILITKSIDWSYEKEWRKILIEGDTSTEYGAEISEVIFWFKTSESDKKLVRNILKKDNVRYFQSNISSNKYALEIHNEQ